jgi:hypothetical protein
MWSDGGPAGDICRPEINGSQVFQTTLNATLDHLRGQVRLVSHNTHRDQKKALVELRAG